MKFRYKSVISKIPIVVELPDDTENADEIKKAVVKFRVKSIVEARRQKKAIQLAKEEGLFAVTSGDFPPYLDRNAEIDTLHWAISKLLPRQQELVDKVYFQGITMAEIAREEGVTVSAISHRLNLIYKRLRQTITEALDRKPREI
jgi:RNA polymerase sigma factor (sigma-70 family)